MMKRIYLTLGILLGLYTLTSLNLIKPQGSRIRVMRERVVPVFTDLDGSLFLAVETDRPLQLEDGDAVEFVFRDGSRKVSFHIGSANQKVVSTARADLFVMIPQDLALSMRDKPIKVLRINSRTGTYTLAVNSRWAPHQLL